MNGIHSSLRILPAEINPPARATLDLARTDGSAPDPSRSDLSISDLSISDLSSDFSSSDLGVQPSGDFRDVLHSAIDDMRQLESQAQTKVAGVLEGGGSDVHSALIAVEKADLSFQLMMQVRNKIVSAYEEISRMQF